MGRRKFFHAEALPAVDEDETVTFRDEASSGEHLSVNFGKRLAHTDKVIRDRGFRVLAKWMKAHPEIKRLDHMKLWKGLYFGMWMADKRPVQQELAVNMALLINDVPHDKQHMWLDTFWETMLDAWEKLDIHRISKYLFFVRVVVAEAFKCIRLRGWQAAEVRATAEIFTKSAPVSSNNAPSLALLLHFNRIMWPEIEHQLEQKPQARPEALQEFLMPFCKLVASTRVESLVRSIHENVLRKVPEVVKAWAIQRVLHSAGLGTTPKKNRQELYDTADILEGKKPGTRNKELSEIYQPKTMLVIPGALRTEKRKKKRKHKKKGDAKNVEAEDSDDDAAAVGHMSPLMLPKPALAVEPLPKAGKKSKRKSAGSTTAEDPGSAAVAEAPDSKSNKKGKKRALPPSPTSQAAEVERGEGAVLGKKRRKKGGSTSPAAAPTAPEGSTRQPSERHVAFDLKSTEVMKFKKKDKVAKTSDPSVEKEGHSKSALRKNGKK